MKRMSLKWKITLWYAGVLLVMTGLLCMFLFYASEQMVQSEAVARLEERVWDFLDEIEVEGDTWELDDDALLYDGGVTYSLYDDSGRLVAGNVPQGFPEESTLKSYTSQKLSEKQGTWNVYDVAVPYGNGRTLWVRGIDDAEPLSAVERAQRNLLMVIGPLLALAALIAGYLITRRALLPAEEIRRTAQEIGESGDLSRRISADKAGGELRQLADTFNQMFAKLEDAFEKERQFTSDASHELRTPLSVIRSEAEYALLPEMDEEEMREGLSVILEQSEQMSDLIAQLLLLARADSGREKLHKEEADLYEITEAAVRTIAPLAKERNIDLSLQGEAGVRVLADRESLGRAIRNLLENAVQYGRDGGWVRATVTSENGKAICRVEDNGIGMAPEHLDHIFDRFYRADPARGSGRGNSGLGLPIVKWIAEEHGGTVTVKSIPGEGSCFTLCL